MSNGEAAGRRIRQEKLPIFPTVAESVRQRSESASVGTTALSAVLPELRLYKKARHAAENELKRRKELKLRRVAQVRHEHPDVLPAFARYGSALESIFKGIMVSKDPAFIGADKISEKLKRHNLVTLALDAGIGLSHHEQYVLKWVSAV